MTTARRFVNRPLIWAQKPPRAHDVIIIINGLIFYNVMIIYVEWKRSDHNDGISYLQVRIIRFHDWTALIRTLTEND